MFTRFKRSRISRPLAGLLAAALACSLPMAARAADGGQKDKPSLTDKTSEMFATLKPLIDDKKWDSALSLIDSTLPGLDPNSYDNYFLLDIKAKIYLQKDEMAKAVAPWETALSLADRFNYGEPHANSEIVHYLAEICFQVGSMIKIPTGDSPQQQAEAKRLTALQREDYAKAISYTRRWLKTNPNPTQEDEIFYSTLLFNTAVSDNGANPDPKMVADSIAAAEHGLRLAIHPKDTLYILLFAALQQAGEQAKSADYLELLLQQYPEKAKAYWSQLMAVYLNLAGLSEKDPLKAREYNVRAITAIERAQALGLLKDPKYNLNLVTIYYTLQQYGKAAELLSTGLRDGSIESALKNWQVLAYCYKEMDQVAKSIDVYKEAEKHFPDVGQLDVNIAQTYAELDNIPESYNYYKIAVKKGGLTNPYTVYVFMAYTAFELQKYGEALSACNEALKFPESKDDAQLKRLKKGIEDTIKVQETEKAQLEKAASST